jgi:putative transcriptional regulator
LYQCALLTTLLFLLPLIAQAASKDELGKGMFVVATDSLAATGYEHAVIYLTEHNHTGSFGVIVNQPLPVTILEVLKTGVAKSHEQDPVYFGGPLHTQFLFVLAQTKLHKGMHKIKDDVYFGAGEEVVVRLNAEQDNPHLRTFAGFASWGPGQLKDEIEQGVWLVAPEKAQTLFDQKNDDLWAQLIEKWSGSWI